MPIAGKLEVAVVMKLRLTLIQPKQNALYDFAHQEQSISAATSRALRAAMAEETLALMQAAPETDLMVTSEAVNFPGLAKQLEAPYAAHVESQVLEERFAALARQKGCYIVGGLYTARDGHLYNEAVVWDRSGTEVARYRKVHLAGDEQLSLTAGEQYCTVDADFGRFGVCVCWDMQFPEVCRHYAVQGVRLVVCPTWGWEQIYAHARAYENGIFVAGAMAVPFQGIIEGIRTPSELVAPDGTVLARASNDCAQSLTCAFDLDAMAQLHQMRMHDRKPDTYQALVSHSNGKH